MLQTTTDGKKTSWKKRKLIHYNMIHFWFVTYTYLVIQLIWPIIFLPKSFIVRKVKPGGDWVCQIISHEPPRFKHFTLLTDWDIKGALLARCFRTEGLLNSAGRLSNFAYKNSSLTSFLWYLSTNLHLYASLWFCIGPRCLHRQNATTWLCPYYLKLHTFCASNYVGFGLGVLLTFL